MATVRGVRKELEEVKETMAKKEGSFAWQMIQCKDKQLHRLVIVICLIASMWMMTTLGFIWYLNQYDFTDYSQDGSGINIIGDDNQEVKQWGKESKQE